MNHRNFTRHLLLAVLVPLVSGCFMSKTSPAVYGIDLRVAPGFAVGSGETTVHPTLGYAFSLAGGVEGESDGVLHIGGQVRVPSSGTWWYGGEATYARRSTSYDVAGIPTESANGWTLAGLLGMPVAEPSWGVVHGYTALGLNKYGGTGPYVRVGVDVQPAFLNR